MAAEEWIANLQASGLGPSGVRKARQVLNAMLTLAVTAGYLPTNPVEGTSTPRLSETEALFLDADEVERLAERCHGCASERSGLMSCSANGGIFLGMNSTGYIYSTLRGWVANLEANSEAAVELVGERRFRVWRLYMSGGINGFEDGDLGLHQILGVKPFPDGRSAVPPTRAAWH